MKYLRSWKQITENKIFKDNKDIFQDEVLISSLDEKSLVVINDTIGVRIELEESNFKYTPFEITNDQTVDGDSLSEIVFELNENSKIIGEETVFTVKTSEKVLTFYTDGTNIFHDDDDLNDEADTKDQDNDWIPEN